MSYFSKIRASIKKATTNRQTEKLSAKLQEAERELDETRRLLSDCEHRCRCESKAKFVVFDKYTNSLLGTAKTRREALKQVTSDDARIMPVSQWLKEGNSL